MNFLIYTYVINFFMFFVFSDCPRFTMIKCYRELSKVNDSN